MGCFQESVSTVENLWGIWPKAMWFWSGELAANQAQ